MRHYLKIWPQNLFPILEGKKTCEVRLNDRDYKVGDVLVLRAWDTEKADWINEMEFEREVTWINLVPGSKFVCLSIKEVKESLV